MRDELDLFLEDLVRILREKYNESHDDATKLGASAEDISYHQGSNLAYYDVLDLIRMQLIAFGRTPDFFEKIVPELGRRAE